VEGSGEVDSGGTRGGVDGYGGRSASEGEGAAGTEQRGRDDQNNIVHWI
jgi:hypothetical protein